MHGEVRIIPLLITFQSSPYYCLCGKLFSPSPQLPTLAVQVCGAEQCRVTCCLIRVAASSCACAIRKGTISSHCAHMWRTDSAHPLGRSQLLLHSSSVTEIMFHSWQYCDSPVSAHSIQFQVLCINIMLIFSCLYRKAQPARDIWTTPAHLQRLLCATLIFMNFQQHFL